MFSEMIEMLKKGAMPDSNSLLPRLKAATAKKSGVIRQPRLYWSSDPKINPDSTHMLWAAILLEDREMIDMAVAIIFMEQGISPEKHNTMNNQALISEKSDELIALAPDSNFKAVLQKKIEKAVKES